MKKVILWGLILVLCFAMFGCSAPKQEESVLPSETPTVTPTPKPEPTPTAKIESDKSVKSFIDRYNTYAKEISDSLGIENYIEQIPNEYSDTDIYFGIPIHFDTCEWVSYFLYCDTVDEVKDAECVATLENASESEENVIQMYAYMGALIHAWDKDVSDEQVQAAMSELLNVGTSDFGLFGYNMTVNGKGYNLRPDMKGEALIFSTGIKE